MSQPKLNADLNRVANSSLTIELLDGDLNIIQKLDDEPNDVGGLSAQDLKAKFDEAGNIIKAYLNETLVPAVLAADATEAERTAKEAEREAHESERQSAEQLRTEAEAGRASAEAERQTAEDLRDAKSSAFMEGVVAVAQTISPDSEASAQAVRVGDSFRLFFGIPRGRQGAQGPPGRRGIDGVAVAASGVFAFNVSADGDLILSYQGEDAPGFSINDRGELIWTA